MIKLLLRRYWKEILAFVSVGILILSMYFLYQKNISLTKEITEKEIALEASERAVELLSEDRYRVDETNKRNALRKAEIQSELDKAKTELDKLKQEAKRNEEKGFECLTITQPDSITARMRRRSDKNNRDSPAE